MKYFSHHLFASENLGRFIFQELKNENDGDMQTGIENFNRYTFESDFENNNQILFREKNTPSSPSDSLYVRDAQIIFPKTKILTTPIKEIKLIDRGLYNCGKFLSDSIMEKIFPEVMQKNNNNAWHVIFNNPKLFGIKVPEEYRNVKEWYKKEGKNIFKEMPNIWTCKNETEGNTPWDIDRITSYREEDLFEDWADLYKQLDAYIEDESRSIHSIIGPLCINNRNSPYGKDITRKMKNDPYHMRTEKNGFSTVTAPASHVGFLGAPEKFKLEDGCKSIQEHFEKKYKNKLSPQEIVFLTDRFGDRWDTPLPKNERYYIDYSFRHQTKSVKEGSLIENIILLGGEGQRTYYPVMYGKVDDAILDKKGLLKNPDYTPKAEEPEVITVNTDMEEDTEIISAPIEVNTISENEMENNIGEPKPKVVKREVVISEEDILKKINW